MKKKKLSKDEHLILASNLKNYAHDLIGTHLKAEYESQIRKWSGYMDIVADAFQHAYDAHIGLLKNSDASRQLARKHAFIALAASAGQPSHWLAASLQHIPIPKYLVRTAIRQAIKEKATDQPAYVRAMRRVFGEIEDTITAFGVLFPLPAASASGAVSLASAGQGDILTFKTTLQQVFSAESDRLTKRILQLAMQVLNNQLFGTGVLLQLYTERAGSEYWSFNEQEVAAKGLVRKWIDTQRLRWYKQWFYYGNDPYPQDLHFMARKIQREIWALWILSEEFKLYYAGVHAGMAPAGDSGFLRQSIVDRFVDLDILLGQKWNLRTGFGGSIPMPSRSMDEQQKRRKENPLILVPVKREGDIDTQEELTALTDWAATHTPYSLDGLGGFVIREWVTIDKVHTQKQK